MCGRRATELISQKPLRTEIDEKCVATNKMNYIQKLFKCFIRPDDSTSNAGSGVEQTFPLKNFSMLAFNDNNGNRFTFRENLWPGINSIE